MMNDRNEPSTRELIKVMPTDEAKLAMFDLLLGDNLAQVVRGDYIAKTEIYILNLDVS